MLSAGASSTPCSVSVSETLSVRAAETPRLSERVFISATDITLGSVSRVAAGRISLEAEASASEAGAAAETGAAWRASPSSSSSLLEAAAAAACSCCHETIVSCAAAVGGCGCG